MYSLYDLDRYKKPDWRREGVAELEVGMAASEVRRPTAFPSPVYHPTPYTDPRGRLPGIGLYANPVELLAVPNAGGGGTRGARARDPHCSTIQRPRAV